MGPQPRELLRDARIPSALADLDAAGLGPASNNNIAGGPFWRRCAASALGLRPPAAMGRPKLRGRTLIAAGLGLAACLALRGIGGLGDPSGPSPSRGALPRVEVATSGTVVVSVDDVARWTGLLRAHGQAKVARRTTDGRDLAALTTVSGGSLDAAAKAEVHRQLCSVLRSHDAQLLAVQVEPDTDLGRARGMATLVLMRKEIELAIAALAVGHYTTGDADALISRLPDSCKAIECGSRLPNGERTRVALIIDKASDPDYAPIERMLNVVAETVVAQQIEAFNRQPAAERRGAFERIAAARAAIAACRRTTNDETQLAALTTAWVRACAVLPHGRAEIAPPSFLMHLR